MSLLVTGSIGIDTVRTPHGKRQDCLGGSSVYFAMAASLFGPVRFVGAVGDDCPFDLKETFAERPVDLTGLEVRDGSKTFRWAGTYHENMNERDTDAVELNVLAEEPPALPQGYRDSQYVFLANTHPALQAGLLDELNGPTLAVADTMNLWIENEAAALGALLERLDGLVLNDSEAILMTGKHNLVTAGREILQRGPRFVVIKKGEHGAVLVTKEAVFSLSAFLSEIVIDPTGAGDSFAGGMMGYLARVGATAADSSELKKAIAYGTVVASYTIEDFSLDQLAGISFEDVEKRLRLLRTMTTF